MKHSPTVILRIAAVGLITVTALLLSCKNHHGNQEAAVIRLIMAERTGVQWITDQLLRPDLNGDGNPDCAVFGITDEGMVSVAVVMSPAHDDSHVQDLEFGTGSCQQCVRSLPVEMTVESTD